MWHQRKLTTREPTYTYLGMGEIVHEDVGSCVPNCQQI